MRRSRGLRLGRGAAAASIATFAALVSHVSAGGAMPTWLGLGVPLVLSLMVCTVLTGRRLSALRTSVSVVLSQALFHVLFVLGASNVMMTEMAGHDHGAMMHSAVISDGATAALYGDTTMWAGHATAALVTIFAIRRGERTLRAIRTATTELCSWLRRRVARLTGLALPLPSVVAVFADADVRVPPLRVVLGRAPRRGPPAFAIA